MPELTFSILDITEQEEIFAYERALYRAFSATESIILEQIWDFNKKEKRVRTKIPYSSQEIYTARIGGRIIAGAAMNYNIENTLQLEMIGFTIDKTEENICEGLALFNLQMVVDDKMIALGLKDFAFDYVKNRRIRKIYGTCPQNKLRGYTLMGWKTIDELMFDKGKVSLIIYEF